MKKNSKFVAIILAMVLCFSLFSGFTYSSFNSNVEPGQINLRPNESKTFYIKTGEVCRVVIGYTGPCAKILVDNENYSNFGFSSGYGVSVLNVNALTNGTHTISFQTEYGAGKFYDYSFVAVVGSGDPATPPMFANAIVKFYADNEKLSSVVSSYTCNLDTLLTNLPIKPTKTGYKFVSWAYFNSGLNEYVNFDTTNLPMISTNKLQNGIFKVVPIFKEIKEYKLTYMTQEPGFLGIKKWKENFTKLVLQDSIVPDVTDKFGISFEYMSTDVEGNSKVTATTKCVDDMNIYVHLREVPDTFEINYKTMERLFYKGTIASDYGHVNFKYDYIKPGATINLNVVVPDVSSIDKTVDSYKFSYWSFDEAGKNKVGNDFVPTKDISIYAQYDGIKVDNATGVLGFFKSINNNILKPMNSWWGIGNSWDYVITVAVLMIAIALAIKLIVFGIKALIGFSFR